MSRLIRKLKVGNILEQWESPSHANYALIESDGSSVSIINGKFISIGKTGSSWKGQYTNHAEALNLLNGVGYTRSMISIDQFNCLYNLYH